MVVVHITKFSTPVNSNNSFDGMDFKAVIAVWLIEA
jgi:hypothetical protein